MKILPEITQPPKSKLQRKHNPAQGRYPTYRQCLRWEFGFSCAFCLLHESDLVDYPIEGTRLTWIEHAVTQKENKALVDEYSNCFYSCHWCNQTRRDKPVRDGEGGSILNPVSATWATHFEASDYQLRPKTLDGRTTEKAYDLNDPRKQERRVHRQKQMEEWLRELREVPSEIRELTTLAAELAISDEPQALQHTLVLQQAINSLTKKANASRAKARENLGRYALVPKGAKCPCSCGEQIPQIPTYLDEQGIEVEI